MKKRITAIMLVLVLVAGITSACGNKDSSREPGDPAKAMFITNSMADAAQVFSWNEFQRLMGEFNIEMTQASGNNEAAVEVDAVERAITEKYDVIFINPTSVEAVLPALVRAKGAGIIVGLFSAKLPDGQTGEDAIDFFCGTDDFLSGIMAGEYVSNHFPDGANAVEVGGPVGDAAQIQLHNGFTGGVADNITILATQTCTGGWNVHEARQIMEDFLIQFGDAIDIVWCHWDEGANAVIGAAQAAGRSDIFIIGVGGSSVGYQNVHDGLQQLSVGRNYTTMVRQSLRNARTLLDGGSVSRMNIIPMDMITPDTIGDFTRPEW